MQRVELHQLHVVLIGSTLGWRVDVLILPTCRLENKKFQSLPEGCFVFKASKESSFPNLEVVSLKKERVVD